MLFKVAFLSFLVFATASYNLVAHVWSSGGNGAPDALVTYNTNNGQVVHLEPLVTGKGTSPTSTKVTDNAPHHMAISADGRWIVTGGLLSFFVTLPTGNCSTNLGAGAGQNAEANGGNRDDVFLFQVIDGIPSFHSAYNVPGGCTDEFHLIPGTSGTWIISQMCNDFGNAPGYLIKFTVPQYWWQRATFSTWGVVSSSTSSFNPHGGAWTADGSQFVIGDFVIPSSLLNLNTRSYLGAYCSDPIAGPLEFGSSVRVFDNHGNQLSVITTPGVGMMAAKWLVNGWAIAAGTVPSGLGGDNNWYLINTATGAHSVAYDLAAEFGGAFSVGIPMVDTQNQRILMSYGMRYAALFSYTLSGGVPQVPFRLLWSYDFGVIAGPTDNQFPVPNTVGTHYAQVSGSLVSGTIAFVNSFVDFPVATGYQGYGTTGSGPFGTTWPNVPGSVDGGVATFLCNFAGAKTVSFFNINGGNPGSSPYLTLSNVNSGGAPHSLVFAYADLD